MTFALGYFLHSHSNKSFKVGSRDQRLLKGKIIKECPEPIFISNKHLKKIKLQMT